MRIAQIAPLAESCPPRFYGGTERIVSYLTEELVAQGHEVTLFATGDSETQAELVPCAPTALRLNPDVRDAIPYHMMMLDQVLRRAHEFDVLHFHIDLLHFPAIQRFAGKTLTTLHGRLDLHDLRPFYPAFPETPLASISYSQRELMPQGVNWAGNVYHGLPSELLPFSGRAEGGYLAFLGRISPEKGVGRAIEIAVRAGLPLRIAAKIDPFDEAYWLDVIRPMVEANPLVEFVGEINERQKAAFLGDALALLFPIDWPEPFGLVMIEAMACGTPVIAFPRGAVCEVVSDGETGYVVRSVEEAVDAVWQLIELNRVKVRAGFERRFTVERMADTYLDIYRSITGVTRNPDVGVQKTYGPAALRVVSSHGSP